MDWLGRLKAQIPCGKSLGLCCAVDWACVVTPFTAGWRWVMMGRMLVAAVVVMVVKLVGAEMVMGMMMEVVVGVVMGLRMVGLVGRVVGMERHKVMKLLVRLKIVVLMRGSDRLARRRSWRRTQHRRVTCSKGTIPSCLALHFSDFRGMVKPRILVRNQPLIMNGSSIWRLCL